MAKVRYVNFGFFILAAVILMLLRCCSTKDIYFYTSPNAISEHRHFIQLELLNTPDDQHGVRNKRDTEAIPTAVVSTSDNKSATPSPPDAILLKPLINSEKKGVKKPLSVPAKEVASAPPTKSALGKNGTEMSVSSNVSTSTPVKPALNEAIRNNTTSQFNVDEDDEAFVDVTMLEDRFNKEVKNDDIYVNKTDNHKYYNSTFLTNPTAGKQYWIDLSRTNETITHDLLSKSHRRAATVKLNFDFPFYGHMIRNVTVATGGFIYTGDYVHSWLAATQYIAPLMANFDTNISNDSYIKFLDNGTAFTVQWENVSLQDNPMDGKFTFQTTLLKNGDIIFVYLNVPDIIKTIQDNFHPVTIGISDAYIIDSDDHYFHRKTIFEYHKVSFKKDDIKNATTIYLKALPTCLQKKDCQSCLNNSDIPYKCYYCQVTRRCSSGKDRFRHEWLTKHCDRRQISTYEDCQSLYNFDENDDDPGHRYLNISAYLDDAGLPEHATAGRMDSGAGGASAVIAGLFLTCLLLLIVMWVVYAYRNPHTTSGQLLIRYRPSQWSWRRGEARYTAATIHM